MEACRSDLRYSLILVFFLFVSCSREIHFVRVNESLPKKIELQDLNEISALHANADSAATPELTLPAGRQGVSELSFTQEQNQIEKHRTIAKSETILSDGARKGSLIQIKLKKSNYKPLATSSYSYQPSPPTQKGKTYGGAALAILGVVALILGIISVFSSSLSVLLIVLGAAALVFGVAILVSGSLSTKPEKSDKKE